MAKTIGEALNLVSQIGEVSITDMSNQMNVTSEHFVNHKYRDEIIVPYVGITNNIQLFLNNGERIVITRDGFRCSVVSAEEKNLCELDSEIMRLYNIDAYTFLKQWYNSDKRIDSLTFVQIKLKKL